MTTAFHIHADPRWHYGGRRHAHPAIFGAALSIHDLRVSYPRASQPAIDRLSFELGEGCLVALVGPNGSGKSTLLKAIAALLPIASGTIQIFGLPPGGCHHRTAYLPQRGEIDWSFPVTVERFVLAGRYVHLGWLTRPRKSDYEVVRRVLDRLDLTRLSSRPIGELSGGQQQRVLIARALAQGADLLLLDEPFNNLDAATRTDLLTLFGELRDANKTLLVATHDFDETHNDFDTVISLTQGMQKVPA